MTDLHAHLEGKSHVIWDWNGTLLSDLDHAVRTVNRMLVEENLPVIDVETYKKVFGFPVVNYYKTLGFRTDREYFIELCERFNRYFHDELHLCDLWPGARELLAQVKTSGRTQSLLSASEHGLLLDSIRQFRVEHLFDHVFGIFDKTAGSKVDRGRELMRTTGLAPSDTVLIGDTDHDLEVGQALGVDVVLVEHGHQCATRLRQAHHRVVKVL